MQQAVFIAIVSHVNAQPLSGQAVEHFEERNEVALSDPIRSNEDVDRPDGDVSRVTNGLEVFDTYIFYGHGLVSFGIRHVSAARAALAHGTLAPKARQRYGFMANGPPRGEARRRVLARTVLR